MRETHKRTADQHQDVSEDLAMVSKRESTRPPHQNENSLNKNTDANTWVENDTQHRDRRDTSKQKRHGATKIVKYHQHVLPLWLKADMVDTVQTASSI